MSGATPVAVVESCFRALAAGQVPEAMAAFARDVVWNQPGRNRLSGRYQGPEAVARLIATTTELSQGGFRAVPTGPAMGNGELVAVPVSFSGRREGQVLGQGGVGLLKVQGGRITEVHLFSSDGPAEDRFWGQI